MRVSFNNNHISFGYNRNLNKELIQRLKSCQDRNYAQSLLSLNNTCNKCEDYIRHIEKKPEPTENENEKKQNCLDIFYSVKQALASFVSVDFEDLNYAEREYEHYRREINNRGNKKDDWRIDICQILAEWTDNKNLIPVTVKEDIKPKQKKKSEVSDPNKKLSPKPTREETDVSDYMPKDDDSDLDETGSLSSASKKKQAQEKLITLFLPTEETPKGFKDVVGMDTLKADLRDGIITYIKYPALAEADKREYGKTTPKSLLLYGPPGCGKTYITQALSQELHQPLLLFNISRLGSHYINKTSKNIEQAFAEAQQIADKTGTTCLVFMDEIDTLGFDRSSRTENEDLKQVGTLLQAIDKAKTSNNLIIIGATNKFKLLDPALKSRFEAKSFVGLPDSKAIKALIKKSLKLLDKGQQLLSSEDDLDVISKMLNGYSNRSIVAINKKAALNAMRRDRADIAVEDYEKAIKEADEEKPDIREYESENSSKKPKIGFQA
ncbi:ATP-binding protein [bacterium]|nr:ATP-binding protein [bacterium]